ncbi:hypothetical protein ABGB18_31780 [Nonomuraea sp. B12E4]|uniref:hypothetical protein n=1 Tax=Nonomuraea sp. B12E4 TaxID=3153564 RepID=UPI00325D874F
MPSITKSRLAVAATMLAVTAGLAGAAGGALAASALQPASSSRYLRAGGAISGDGVIAHHHGLVSVTRVRAGVYCVRTELSDVRRAIALGTARPWGRVVTTLTTPHSECDNRQDTIRVTVADHNRAAVDGDFTIALP